MALMAIEGLTLDIIISKIESFCKFDKFINLKDEDDEKIITKFILGYIKQFKSPNFELWKSFGDLDNSENIYNNMDIIFFVQIR